MSRRARGVGGDEMFLAQPSSHAVYSVDQPLSRARAEFRTAACRVTIRHRAPQRARLRGNELSPRETGIEQAPNVALAPEEALVVLHHLVVPPRSVRPVLSAHGVEREVEAGTKGQLPRARELNLPGLSDVRC